MMPVINYIEQYYQAILDGREVVGRWIRIWYKMVLDGVASGTWFYDGKKARRVIRFVETMCHHSKGRRDYIKLELWQKAFLSVVFGIVDSRGFRQFWEVVLVVGRKNGKTLIVACIGDYILLCSNEYGIEIYNLAPKLDQARIVFDAAAQIIKSEPELSDMADVKSREIVIEDTNSFMRALGFASKKSDGYNPSLCTNDEFGSWRGDAGLKQYEAMRSGMGSRSEPMMLSMSTAGYEVDGLYDELLRRCTSFLTGASKETRLAPFLYMIDDVSKWNVMDELRKANPNLGVSITEEYLREEIAIAEGSLSKRVEFITKYCNIRQNSSVAWLEGQYIEQMAGPELRLEDFRGCYCVGGIDLSKTLDLTSCCVVIEKGGELYVISMFYMPAQRQQTATEEDGVPYAIYEQQGLLKLSGESHIDYDDCYRWFRDLVEKYKIYPLKIGYDKYSSTYLVDKMKAYGFHMDDVNQGYNLTPVINETQGLIQDGKIHVGSNNLLKIHFYNTSLKMDTGRNKVMIVKSGSRTRIDGVAAFLDAMTVRQKWFSEIGQQLRNTGK